MGSLPRVAVSSDTTVHLVCGFLGAGKTTFARALEEQQGAVRFSIDELYLRLFADGPSHVLHPAQWARLEGVLHALWPRVAAAGVDVVLDFGFWSRAQRDDVRRRVRAVGARTRLHWLQCSDATALARCLRRNGTPGAFLVSPEGYAALRARFEPPAAEECAEVLAAAAGGEDASGEEDAAV